jgi:hypothetical protein
MMMLIDRAAWFLVYLTRANGFYGKAYVVVYADGKELS